jgi:hypothetical protein
MRNQQNNKNYMKQGVKQRRLTLPRREKKENTWKYMTFWMIER